MPLLVTHEIIGLHVRRESGLRQDAPSGMTHASVLRAPADILDAHARLRHRIRPDRIQMRHAHGLQFVLLSRGDQPLGSTWLVHGGMRYIDEFCWGFPLGPNELWVRDVFVRPDARGQGIFAALLQASTQIVAPDWTSIWSDVDADNLPSLKAHYGAGFVDRWRVRCYELLGRCRWRPLAPDWPRPTAHLTPGRRFVCLTGAVREAHLSRIA
jgi:GNAT superfamily N-acetyltransferase